MKNETKERIESYKEELPRMKEKVAAAGAMFLIALITAVTATYAWVTISRAPEVNGIATTVAANGNLEIALSDADGLQPDEFDVDEGAAKTSNVVTSNLQWGNLVNLSDASYGIDNLALRPAQLNTASLLTSPLWGAAYGQDGRITMLDSNYAYAKFDGKQFTTSQEYGVRAIASYKATVADSTQAAYNEKRDAALQAHTAVNTAYSALPGKFAALGTMISKFVEDRLNKSTPGTNLAPYLQDVYALYKALDDAMIKEKDAYVALANFQSYVHAKSNNLTFHELTWEDLEKNAARYNAANAETASKDEAVSLIGLTQFIKDLKTMEEDIEYLLQYRENFTSSGTAYYWKSGGETGHQIEDMIVDLIDYRSMTIDLNNDGKEVKIASLDPKTDAGALMGALNQERKVYVYGGVMKRFEQSAVDENYRLNGNAQCTIRITFMNIPATVYGKAYTKASGTSDFMQMYGKATGGGLTATDAVAEDTYGMAVDLWVRTNAEQTCLTLEGATVVDDSTKQILRYDGVNRIWGSTADSTVLTTDSTTQGGGSCYIYYADTPEDMRRSLELLDAMKVAFVDQNGNLLATAGMDTENYFGETGRITVPLVLDNDTKTTYEYTNSLNETLIGRAITTLYTDTPVRIEAIVYLDGTMLTNDDVLAAAEIQGQLNLQFGSSEALETAGDNNLIDDTRTVTAEATNPSMDFDTATSEDDLTTKVTLHVQGTDPKQATAFFVRAINSTQGSREDTMKFTRQEDGTWTASYHFTAPGTYYLRHVRLDGVDYALADPVKIEVSGFSLKSVTWGEPANTATVRSSSSSYNESVAVEFATNDVTKMPNAVEARFVRTDGNTVNVSLGRGSDGRWTGTANFTTSGVYTLEYLVYKTGDSSEGKYKDLVAGGFAKTLDLALGMYVSVQDLTGSLTQNFEEGKTYSKDVAVVIYDNAGNVMSGLEGATLVYSNGGSSTNTVRTPLTWNELDARYDGVLPIITAGRYQFAYVSLGGQSLTKASESPVYTIISPDPPIYDENSQSTYHKETQYVPLTNDAVIDRISIANAASARISAVVYNDKSGAYYTVDSSKVSYSGSAWSIALPTYTLDLDEDGKPAEGASYTQDGTWSVVALLLTECYDSSSTYRGEENPIIWVGSDAISEAYAKDSFVDENGKQMDYESKDFSKLSTTVSCSVHVEMTAGTTKLGGSSTAFMQKFQTNQLGMSVKLTDDNGNVIPAKKVTDVTLKVQYTPPTDSTAYGYKVQSGAARPYEIKLNSQDAESGLRTVSSSHFWQYAGRYTVEGLTVSIGGKELTFAAGDKIGVPTEYTLTTQGPTEENISVENIKQTATEFGKDGNNITGLFLDSHDLKGTNAEVSLTPKDVEGKQYAVMENVSAKLKLTYTGGSDTNGGYTWEGTSPYQNLELTMTRGDGSNIYKAGRSTLLAGTYKAEIEVAVGGKTTAKKLSDISVYSKKPDVTMALADGTPTSVTVNAEGGAGASDNIFTATNKVEDHTAVVFAKYRRMEKGEIKGKYSSYEDDGSYADEFAAYEMPGILFTLADGGKICESFTLEMPANPGANSVTFAAQTSVKAQIGGIEEGTEGRPGTYTVGILSFDCTYSYSTQKPLVAGELEMDSITAVEKDVTYKIKLANKLSIVQKNEVPPSITFVVKDERFKTPAAVNSEDGRAFTYKLPETLETADGSGTSVTFAEILEGDPVEISSTAEEFDIDKEKPLDKIPDTDWTPLDPISPNKIYTVSTNVVKGSDFGAATYQKQKTSTLYTRGTFAQTTEFTKTLYGTTVVEKEKKYNDVVRSLDYWLVDGRKYAPGSTIKVGGNTEVVACYRDQRTLKQREVIRTTTTGGTIYNYIAGCEATKTVKVGDGAKVVGTEYCSHNKYIPTCLKTRGNKSDAEKETVSDPLNAGYTKVSSATEGTVRTYDAEGWRIKNTTSEGGATVTTVTEVYDAAGNLINQY